MQLSIPLASSTSVAVNCTPNGVARQSRGPVSPVGELLQKSLENLENWRS
jgi:hypothetical protein